MKKRLSLNYVYTPPEINTILIPLVQTINSQYRKNKTTIIGFQGGQGTGKTTLVKFIQDHLQQQGYRVISFSLDDFYTSYEEREKLRQKYPHNPFYQISRGLPGTHRAKYLKEVLRKLKRGKSCELPIFDKSLHHAAGDISKRIISVKGRVDVVLFEGWCLGIPVVSSVELMKICRKNKIPLEKINPTLHDYQVVLKYTRQYQALWKYLDFLVMLKPENSNLHLQWRWQQEQELKQKTGKGMTREQVEQFVLPFLPFTYLCYEKVKADVRLLINGQHEIYKLVARKI